MSTFFKNRAKNEHERAKKFKKQSQPIEQTTKEKRSATKKVLNDSQLEELFDEAQAEKILKSLNQEQKQAALSDNTHNLVIASAGTGKTSTIVARVVHLLKQGTLPSNIMLITFTSKAVEEMRERIKKYIQPQIANDILIGTFHSTAIALLKQNNIPFNLQMGGSLFSLFDLSYNKHISAHPLNEGSYKSSSLFDMYSSFQAKRKGRGFAEWFVETFPTRENHFDSLEHYDTIFALHEELLERENIVGFNELLLFAKQNAHRFKNSFHEIIIDEYQDTSFLQTEYIEALSFKQLFCVGDYDQSIYAFNGADITIIGSFKNHYPHASVINLKKNYRSRKPILELAQKSISIEVELKNLDINVIRDDKSSFFDIDEVRYTLNLLRLLSGSDKL